MLRMRDKMLFSWHHHNLLRGRKSAKPSSHSRQLAAFSANVARSLHACVASRPVKSRRCLCYLRAGAPSARAIANAGTNAPCRLACRAPPALFTTTSSCRMWSAILSRRGHRRAPTATRLQPVAPDSRWVDPRDPGVVLECRMRSHSGERPSVEWFNSHHFTVASGKSVEINRASRAFHPVLVYLALNPTARPRRCARESEASVKPPPDEPGISTSTRTF